MTVGLVLAAGASSRMGQPKALIELDGRTFIESICATLWSAGLDDIIVVAGAEADRIVAAVPAPARTVIARDWQRGMRASLRAGLGAAGPGPVMLTHVDRPRIAAATLAQLLDAASPDAVTVPYHGGEPGHPVVLPAAIRHRLDRDDDTPLRDVIAAFGIRRVDIDDPGILLNVNTPADLARLAGLDPVADADCGR